MTERVYRATNALGRGVLRMLGIDTRWTGVEHVPRSGPVILAATHVSYPDFILLEQAAVDRGRYVRFLCRHDVWQLPLVRTAMDRMQHVPVDREAPAGAYLRARRLLREGEAVGAFPEAGISWSHTVRSLMPGVASLARETGAPVVPVAIWGSQRLWSVGLPDARGRKPRPSLRRGRRVDLSFGEPITFGRGRRPHRVHPAAGRAAHRPARGAAAAAAPRATARGERGTVVPRAPRRAGAHPCRGDPVRRGAALGGQPDVGAGLGRRAARRFSTQPNGLVNGSSTRRTGGVASRRARPTAPRIVRTSPSTGWASVKSG